MITFDQYVLSGLTELSKKKNSPIKIIGAGIFGCSLARILADNGHNVEIIEKRSVIGGNCYSYYDDSNNIEIHKYGSHIFHTNNEIVWNFINKYSSFNNYIHKVVAIHNNESYFLPINLSLLNQFFRTSFSPERAEKFIDSIQIKQNNPKNFEEKVKSLIGSRLYEAFFKNYTKKQWSKEPTLLDASLINRIPIRFNYNVNYFEDKYQGIPLNGYTKMFESMVDSPNIKISVNTPYSIKDMAEDYESNKYFKIVYCGALDELFNYNLGELQWRSLKFETEELPITDYQGNSVINYVDDNFDYTRIHEFKHYHNEQKELMKIEKTVIQKEYPNNWERGKEIFYPVINQQTNDLYNKYLKLLNDSFNNMVIVGGRLGLYKYLDMDDAIEKALEISIEIENN